MPVSCGQATRPSARWPAAAARPARSPAERALAMSTRTAPDPDRVGRARAGPCRWCAVARALTCSCCPGVTPSGTVTSKKLVSAA